MSDPITGLESFDREGPTVHPLPAAEARRLGDRLRRRNTALAVLGAAVAVVVIAAPIAALTRGEDHAAPQPTSPTSTGSPAPTSPVTPNGVDIPAGFPLLAGYPANSQSEGGSYGREGPNRALAPLVPEACGVRVPLPPYTDLLRAGGPMSRTSAPARS